MYLLDYFGQLVSPLCSIWLSGSKAYICIYDLQMTWVKLACHYYSDPRIAVIYRQPTDIKCSLLGGRIGQNGGSIFGTSLEDGMLRKIILFCFSNLLENYNFT